MNVSIAETTLDTQVPLSDLDAVGRTLARIDACTCFHDLLFYHDQERPDAVAVEDGSGAVT